MLEGECEELGAIITEKTRKVNAICPFLISLGIWYSYIMIKLVRK